MSIRMSVTESTRLERNGSCMHTMIENLDENALKEVMALREKDDERMTKHPLVTINVSAAADKSV